MAYRVPNLARTPLALYTYLNPVVSHPELDASALSIQRENKFGGKRFDFGGVDVGGIFSETSLLLKVYWTIISDHVWGWEQ